MASLLFCYFNLYSECIKGHDIQLLEKNIINEYIEIIEKF